MTEAGAARGPLGLIAGNGRFPFLVAAGARRAGRRVVAVAIREEASPDLEKDVDELHWVGLGQLGRCIEALRSAGAREAVMAGQVKHRQIFSDVVPDLKMVGLLAKLAFKNTDSLIGAVADVLGKEGITLLPSTAFLQEAWFRDTVAAAHNLDPFTSLLRRDGTLVLLGAPAHPHPSPTVFNLLLGRRSIAGSGIGGIPETQEMLDFCAQKGITADIELIPIQKINDAYERMLAGDVRYRFVIDMKSLAAG